MADRTLYAAATHIASFRQSENAALTYAIEWSGLHNDVATSAWEVTDGDGTVTGAALSGNRTRVTISSGGTGWTTVTNRITTDSGQTDERQIRVDVQNNEQGYRGDAYTGPRWY